MDFAVDPATLEPEEIGTCRRPLKPFPSSESSRLAALAECYCYSITTIADRAVLSRPRLREVIHTNLPG
jgi:hypothetical protein